ncbi:hypothetical protein SLEP1_g36729 [Rubroshorea leprosula]|uniref:Uncharacterized protein n=1 Tax=Rubroshorea leprosula TaxID=152421 RepID=A0AAV5KSM7_9ROSI|nr:hypothetical protein SLEP1_g36729 [Rubroshorea leprosula]
MILWMMNDCQSFPSNFGLAKCLPPKWTYHSITPTAGTFGFLLHSMWELSTRVLYAWNCG